MSPPDTDFNPGDVLACTTQGTQASSDNGSNLAAGFRRLLRAINGKRTIADLYAFLPDLEAQKVGIWLDEARRMGLVKMDSPGAPAVPAPGAAFEYAGYIESDAEVAALAKDISKWVKAKPQASIRARSSDLNKTVGMATMQSGEALHTLTTSGVLTSNDGLRLIGDDAGEAMFPPIGDQPAEDASRPKVALLVEDELPDLGKLAGLLGAAGYEIRATATRQQFVDELNNPEPPDVLFLKLGSRTVDTFKTLDKIRQHPVLRQLAIVITGETPTREEIAKAILLGASGWVVKPYTSEKIAAALGGALTVIN